MLMKLFLTWPGWLNNVPVDDELKLGCRRFIDDVVDGCSLAKAVDVSIILLAVIFPSRPRLSWTDEVVVDDGSSCG